MPLIDVKRNGKAIAAATVEEPSKTTLSALREMLGSKMLSSDEFLSKAGSPIERVFQELEIMVNDVLDQSALNIRGAEVSGPATIRVIREGKSTPVQAKVSDLLSDFRKQLASQSPPLIDDNERFQEKENAGSCFPRTSENTFKVEAATDKDHQIRIVPASPKRDITVQKGTTSQKFPEVEEAQSLLQFKKYLVANDAMGLADTFTVGGADISDEQADKISVGKAADKDNKIVIKVGQPILGTTVVTVNPSDPTKGLRDWNQAINYGTQEFPVPTKFAGKAVGTKSDAEDKWSALKDNEKQYVFSVRQLARAIVFSKSTAHGGISGAELTKADNKAVSICVAQPGVKEQNLSAQSSFLMTYSQTVHELRKRAVTNVSASVGAKGVAVKGGFSTSNMEINNTDRSTLYMSQLIYKPAVELYFDPDNDVLATDAFINDIKKAMDKHTDGDPFPGRTRYYELLRVLDKYGHFLPTRFMLGGALVIEEVKEAAEAGRVDERGTSFSSGVGAEIQGVTAAVEAGNTQEVKTLTTNLASKQSIKISAIGGDTGTFSNNDPSNWLSSLRFSGNWAVIDYADLMPTIRYLPKDLLRGCLGLIKAHWADPQTEERTTLNMLEYATLAESSWMNAQLVDAPHEIYGGNPL